MSRSHWTWPFVVAALTASCSSALPDLQRGRAALAAGNTEAAVRDFAPLAERGYPEAQIGLARIHGARGTPADIARAVNWYRSALKSQPTLDLPLARMLIRSGTPAALYEAEQLARGAEPRDEPQALAVLIALYTDHPELDRSGDAGNLVRRAEALNPPLRQASAAVVRWYRAAPAGVAKSDQLAAYCRTVLDILPDCYSDLARHYRAQGDTTQIEYYAELATTAYRQHRISMPVVERFARNLITQGEAGEPQPGIAYRLLSLSAEHSPAGQVLLANLLIQHPGLDRQTDPVKLLESAYANGSAEAALALGQRYMEGGPVVVEPRRAEGYLIEAARTLPAAHLALGTLYERGMLGEADPVRALDHYLSAARAGSSSADWALAQMFMASRGIVRNTINAYVFASLAAHNTRPGRTETATQSSHQIPQHDAERVALLIEAREAVAQLRKQMTPHEVEQADVLIGQELALRGTRAAILASGSDRADPISSEATLESILQADFDPQGNNQ
ncbi:MAG: hypothetical protein AB7I68_04530 [Porticoccaceae bacterium]